jgi:hypothetical protein
MKQECAILGHPMSRLNQLRESLRIATDASRGRDAPSLRQVLDHARRALRLAEAWVAEEALGQWSGDDAARLLGESRRSLLRWNARSENEEPKSAMRNKNRPKPP